ncbi:MAG: 7,8-didemethyl-8-hydroxy-5-deazariboflavin synthase subunit CofG [Polyangiaceae bacterium]|nr:7,8-didemethyl-8-hydroxy-5-deazariboflavin synthase subunit CofG [Polyangiaceae bacterium]MCB9606128.1 7,8-didemethyl-8-hydroxy-5-deazariboflavin synthase subunit CofG [Polyangiaceae bacterium]
MAEGLEISAQKPLSGAAAKAWMSADGSAFQELLAAARERRDSAFPGKRLTFSPKVFLPLTNLCRNRCDYCSFRKSWGQKGAETFTHETTLSWLDRAQAQGCVEALFCLGDTPETAYPEYGALLASWGHDSTVDYIAWSSERALERDLLPHTNAGILSAEEMRHLKHTNVSLGLMLENISPRLCEAGGVHRNAPDKHPAKRMAMLEAAGELRIPFTTGILLGIGETNDEIVDSLLAIADLHARHGHIQEVIVQNFRARPKIPMRDAPEPDDVQVARCVALARLILPEEVSVQAPPNLNPHATRLLIDAGINDFGGISPVTPDYINPIHPWPHLIDLEAECREAGFELRPRLPIYPDFVARTGFLSPELRASVARAAERLARVSSAAELAPSASARVAPPVSQPLVGSV